MNTEKNILKEKEDFNKFVFICQVIGIMFLITALPASIFLTNQELRVHIYDIMNLPCFVIPYSDMKFSSYQNTTYAGGLAVRCGHLNYMK